MIMTAGELAVLISKYDAQQEKKNEWKAQRYEALDYYNGITTEYTENYFSSTTAKKIPIGNVNITKRIIDRVSLVYMTPPKRVYTREDLTDMFVHKDMKLQRLERMTNLLDSVLIKPCWRYKEDGTGCIEYDIIVDYECVFGDDPLKPVGYVYPISSKSSVLDNTPELWAYWDKENHYVFDANGNIVTNEENPDNINPYPVLPFVDCWRDGKPETEWLDTTASHDLIQTNLAINVAETNKNANVMFQSFGYLFVNGAGIDKDTMKIGQDKINYLGVDGSISIVSPPNAIPALDESIKSSYKLLSQNYHLPTSFVEGTTAESGVALKMRNIELTDDRKSDVEKWRNVEYSIFDIEKAIVAVELGQDAGDLEDVDFEESIEILSDKEQRERWEWELSHGLIDKADIMMQKNPDLTRDEAEDYLFDRQEQEMDFDDDDDDVEENSLLNSLRKPVKRENEDA